MTETWQDRGDADLSAPRETKWLTVAFVIVFHVAVILGLVRAFAPEFTAKVADQVLATFNVTVVTPPTPKPPPPPPSKAPKPAGEAAEIGKKAVPKEASAPKPRIAIAKQDAPPVAGKGDPNAAGAASSGQGTGAGGQGSGTGAGGSGSGQGGGAATKAVKIAGDINSARDYPRQSRDLRIGDSVTVALTVGTDGRVRGCRIHRPSKDPEADRITCRLASERFRFKPAMDAQGNAVESVYGWQQRWFYPGERN